MNKELRAFLKSLIEQKKVNSVFYGVVIDGLPEWIYLRGLKEGSLVEYDTAINQIVDENYDENDDAVFYPLVLQGDEEPKLEPAFLLF